MASRSNECWATSIYHTEVVVQGYNVPDYRTGSIVVAVQSSSAVGLLDYCCSSRVLVLPTAQLNARRSGLQPHIKSLAFCCSEKGAQYHCHTLELGPRSPSSRSELTLAQSIWDAGHRLTINSFVSYSKIRKQCSSWEGAHA